jgi:hypothetical protein
VGGRHHSHPVRQQGMAAGPVQTSRTCPTDTPIHTNSTNPILGGDVAGSLSMTSCSASRAPVGGASDLRDGELRSRRAEAPLRQEEDQADASDLGR